MSRLLTILYIIFCLEIGVLLIVLPWTSIWTRNYLAGHYPWISSIAHNYFFRGGVSGLGAADVWLACFEFWRLRRHLGFEESRPNR